MTMKKKDSENFKKFEKIPVKIYPDDKQACQAVAQRIAELINENNHKGRKTVLGLATGHTPINVYRELIRRHREEGLDFSRCVTFNLDEYWPIEPEALQSFHRWMKENLFDHINVPPGNIHIPSGVVAAEKIKDYCQEYEKAIERAGGIDLQILGIGRSGHIGFNEPGTLRNSTTHQERLDNVTRKDAASDFFGEEYVPQTAITMGVGTILKARQICLLSFGEHKAAIIRRAVEEQISAVVAASYLQEHPSATVYLDESAAADLTRIATPWLTGEKCLWDDILQRQAVIWLARKLDKPILKLTHEDYAENSLADLLQAGGGAYKLNIAVFRRQMATITGWPAGKNRKQRILVLSPHPDDDVISMGGVLMRLAQQKHEVHTAYMVSGYLSVFDHNVSRYADFVREFNNIFNLTPQQSRIIEQHIDKFLLKKKPGEVDTPEIQAIKGLIRRTEAIDAAKYCGIAEENIHFLDMPFYNTGKVQKLSLTAADIAAVKKIIEKIKPQIIFAAGDLSDPHGTHRQCLEAILTALQDKKVSRAKLWLYRGAWQEWSPAQIEIAVPLSPDELRLKRYAIFRHESQKDRAMFPGPYDSREFWQRAEDRNMTTARIYDDLGLPEYHALEAFARWPLARSQHLKSQLER